MFDHDFESFPELSNVQLDTLRFVSPHVQIEDDFNAKVVKVHDGDTVTLRTQFRDFDFPLRLAGIDAPEMNNGGAYARDWLRSRVEGLEVSIVVDPNNRVGKYGRLIGEVFSGGQSVSDEMLSLGIVSEFGMKNEGQIENFNVLMERSSV